MNDIDKFLTDYDYVASAFADAYLTGLDSSIIWQAFLISNNGKQFYEALDASVKLHDIIHKANGKNT